jgi:hypothetical protein
MAPVDGSGSSTMLPLSEIDDRIHGKFPRSYPLLPCAMMVRAAAEIDELHNAARWMVQIPGAQLP